LDPARGCLSKFYVIVQTTESLSTHTPARALGVGSEPVEVIDPLRFPGWDCLLARAGESSFFQSLAWAKVLHETYGHRPVYFCRFNNGSLEELLPVMEVASVWTGRRGVSLPFTDFCPTLLRPGSGSREICVVALAHGRQRGWRYFECRNRQSFWEETVPSVSFLGHIVELQADEGVLFQRLESAMRRAIRKAESSGLEIEFGQTSESVRTYYGLHCLTRARHGVPPQPIQFFDKIAEHVLGNKRGFTVTARLDGRPVASAVFFCHNHDAIYKFGASDFAYQHLRPNNILMWAAIKHLAKEGFRSLHMGRTSVANDGLRRFKLAFGAREEKIDYFKYDLRKEAFVPDVDRAETWVNHVFRRMPRVGLRLIGRMLYPRLS
jgi:hypothetical protein